MGNATDSIAAAKHSGSMTNKLTAWGTNDPTIKVESQAKAADSLAGGTVNTTSTYGWVVREITAVKAEEFQGWTLWTPETTKVYVDAKFVAGTNVNGLGVGSVSAKSLDWKLKAIKRFKGTTLALDLTKTVTADSDRWMQSAPGSTDANKYYAVGVKSKVSAGETTGPKTDGIASTIVVIPRHATDLAILEVASTVGTAFMKHNICLRAQATAATTCDTTVTTDKPATKIPNSDAKFFNQ